MVALFATEIAIRAFDAARLAEWTREQAIATVETTTPMVGSDEHDLVLPGEIQAFFDARIRARVNGYVRDWKYDIGASVKAGEVLATIEAPELDEQLRQAKGEQARVEAELDLANLTSKRWSALRASTAVSQQSADEKSGDLRAKTAAVAAARANVERLKALQGFAQLISPFSGIVTARNVDIGALVGPDRTQELFSVADIHQVRIYVAVPQAYASQLSIGMDAKLGLPQYPDRFFQAKVVTTSNAIAERSRTLLTQLLADNPDGALLPGAYAEVHFKLPDNAAVLRIPAKTVLYRGNELNVATVGPDRKVNIKPIKVARDLGGEIEVASGVLTKDRIIVNPSEVIQEGEIVRLADEEISDTAVKAQSPGAKAQ